MTARDIQELLASMANPVKAAHAQRFFKTGPGEYGEGDIFRGIRVPELRRIAQNWKKVSLDEMLVLLRSDYHEDRFVALCLLVHAFKRGNQYRVYNAYLEHTSFVNNWDLVDTSAHKILGPYLFKRPRTPLYTLARSDNLWERRIAIISTYYFIKRDQYNDTLALSDILAHDQEDLIHKACGWMLREVGKRDESVLAEFLDDPTIFLPRTALRYAIERFDQPVRRAYMAKRTDKPAEYHVTHWRAYRYVMDAANRLKGEVVETKALRSKELGKDFGAIVFLKLENEQRTGSFKYRGALNKLLSLNEPLCPVVAASTGNHGLAVARVLEDFGAKGTIYLPVTTEEHKREALSDGVADLVFSGDDGIDAECEARRVAEQEKLVFVSPYNDWQIIAGQGTVGVELLRQAGSLDYVFVSVGGGGLISGLALILKTHLPTIKIIGCSPIRSNVMQASVEAGRIVEQLSQPTLSDGTAGQIESDTITLPLCADLVDEWLTATEEEIADAMRRVYLEHGIKIEGAAGVAVACFLGYKKNLTKKRLALIICGGNISDEKFQTVLDNTN